VAVSLSMLGTTTRVRAPAGMPLEKSIRGSVRGATSSVAAQLTSATPSSLNASTPNSAVVAHNHAGTAASACNCSSRVQAPNAAIAAIGSRYAGSGSVRRAT